jgi:hypothetical protein
MKVKKLTVSGTSTFNTVNVAGTLSATNIGDNLTTIIKGIVGDMLAGGEAPPVST